MESNIAENKINQENGSIGQGIARFIEQVVKGIPSILLTFLLGIYYIAEALVLSLTPNFLRIVKSLNGSTILVTGGAGGVGQELVSLLVKYKTNVIVWDNNEKAMKKLRDRLNEQGFKIYIYTVDLADKTAIYKAAELVKNDLGPVDILINNAGIVCGETFLNLPDSMIEKTYKINTLACYWTTKAFLPDMIKLGHGHIATMVSLTGLLGTNKCTDYSGSKYAVIGFYESLMIELQSMGYNKIYLTMVCPYFINTGMFEGCKPTLMLPPMLDPKEVANRTILAIRRKEVICTIPSYSGYILGLKNYIPSKLLLLIQSKVMCVPKVMKTMRKFKNTVDC